MFGPHATGKITHTVEQCGLPPTLCILLLHPEGRSCLSHMEPLLQPAPLAGSAPKLGPSTRACHSAPKLWMLWLPVVLPISRSLALTFLIGSQGSGPSFLLRIYFDVGVKRGSAGSHGCVVPTGIDTVCLSTLQVFFLTWWSGQTRSFVHFIS